MFQSSNLPETVSRDSQPARGRGSHGMGRATVQTISQGGANAPTRRHTNAQSGMQARGRQASSHLQDRGDGSSGYMRSEVTRGQDPLATRGGHHSSQSRTASAHQQQALTATGIYSNCTLSTIDL